MSPVLVSGKITFEDEAPPFTGATMYVQLENVTVADIAAPVVACHVQRDVAFDTKDAREIPFAIAVNALDARASYSVRVHIDVDGDGEVSRGDFVTTQSHPVITRGHPREVSILVRRVH